MWAGARGGRRRWVKPRGEGWRPTRAALSPARRPERAPLPLAPWGRLSRVARPLSRVVPSSGSGVGGAAGRGSAGMDHVRGPSAGLRQEGPYISAYRGLRSCGAHFISNDKPNE